MIAPARPRPRGIYALAIPAVCVLILFLGYFSQLLYNRSPDLLPGALTVTQTVVFNTLLACVWLTYWRACTVDPGRYDLAPKRSDARVPPTSGWCRKCAAPKPPRAHHCRHCARCVPKMDHHCPWLASCVSLQTFPHFVRFLVFANAALVYHAYLFLQRCHGLWAKCDLPAYLGPSVAELVGLATLGVVGLGVAISLGLLLVSTVRGWALNRTTIEDWEVGRHEAVLDRSADERGRFWHAADVLVEPSEFPYDVGIFENMAQAMGTRNIVLWFWPLAGGPLVSPTGKGVGWEYDENGLNDRPGMWPPVDPDKVRRTWPGLAARAATDAASSRLDGPDARTAFVERQQRDMQRQKKLWDELEEYRESEGSDAVMDAALDESGHGWANSEGDTLWDYGVDEDAEGERLMRTVVSPAVAADAADDDVPIAELIRRRKASRKEADMA